MKRFSPAGAVPLCEVTPSFRASLDVLRGVIAEHIASPHTFNGRDITGGGRLYDIVSTLCDYVNRAQAICPPRFEFSFTARCDLFACMCTKCCGR